MGLIVPLSDILVENCRYKVRLKTRILKAKLLEHKCSSCGNDGAWLNQELVLQLDHINGVNDDNRIENLRFLCPNCHSQTLTFCGKNFGKNRDRNRRDARFGSREEYYQAHDREYERAQVQLVERVLESKIDFSKFGWVRQVALVLGLNASNVKQWMQRFMPDFYEKRCFKVKRCRGVNGSTSVS